MEKGRRIQSTRNAGARARFALSKMLDPAGEAESDDEDPFADIDSEDDEELENTEILERTWTSAQARGG